MISGTADEARFGVAGSGDINARNFTARKVSQAGWRCSPGGTDRWHIDIRLQRGSHAETETVFLDI